MPSGPLRGQQQWSAGARVWHIGAFARCPPAVETGLTRLGTGRGVIKRAAADWLVEEALDGSLVSTGAAESTASEMLDMFAGSWRTLGVDHAPVDPDEQAIALAAFDDLDQNACTPCCGR